jgi:hypothetical protein
MRVDIIGGGGEALASAARARFVQRFGAAAAAAIEKAAEGHRETRSGKGSDPFRWAVVIALGFQCMEVGAYRENHGIEPPWPELKAWLFEPEQRAWLSAHDGDLDALALLTGRYNEFMPEKADAPG